VGVGLVDVGLVGVVPPSSPPASTPLQAAKVAVKPKLRNNATALEFMKHLPLVVNGAILIPEK
jgi:hypothetical protein